MLAWLQAVLPECKVGNLTTDWNSGVLLSALVDYCKPGLFPHWKRLGNTRYYIFSLPHLLYKSICRRQVEGNRKLHTGHGYRAARFGNSGRFRTGIFGIAVARRTVRNDVSVVFYETRLSRLSRHSTMGEFQIRKTRSEFYGMYSLAQYRKLKNAV